MKSYKKIKQSHRSKTQKLYNMKGCSSSLAKCKKGGKKCKMCWGAQKGGCGCGLMSGGKKRRTKRMLAYPSSNNASQTAFAKDYLAYTGKGGANLNPNLPYGQVPPTNNEFPNGVVNQDVIYGPTNTYGGNAKRKSKKVFAGGNSGKWPDGLTGAPWGANNNELPGADRISGDRNYLQHNYYNKGDPQTAMIPSRALSGGAKSRKRRGGGLIPQDLVNMGREVMFGLGSSYDALLGYHAPVNPMPYKDQAMGTPNVTSMQYYRL